MNKENVYQLIKDVKDGVINMNDVSGILDEKTTPIKMDIPLNQFDDGDDDDDFVYEDDLIDDFCIAADIHSLPNFEALTFEIEPWNFPIGVLLDPVINTFLFSILFIFINHCT